MNDLKGTITKPPELPFTFGEYVDFIGGRSWQSFCSELVGKGENIRLQRLQRYESVLTGSNLYLNDSSLVERLALEKMYLKVCLVREVYQRIHDYRNVTRSDFGEINEDTFRVGMEASRVLAPAFWSAFVAVDSNARKKIVAGESVVNSRGAETKKLMGCVDHYKLGILLLRAVVVNHKQSVSTIENALVKVMGQIKEIVRSDYRADRRVAIYKCFDSAISSQLFCIANIEYKPTLNSSFSSLGKMWKRLLIVAFKLCSYNVFKKTNGFELLAKEWFSLSACLNELDELKKIIKEAMLYEPSSVNEDLHSLLNSLISDKNWLRETLRLDKEDVSGSIPQDKVVYPGDVASKTGVSKQQPNIRDKTHFFSEKPVSTGSGGLSLLSKDSASYRHNHKKVNDIADNSSLNNTVMQVSEFSENCNVSKW